VADRNLVVTGSSRGIGAATALMAAKRGWNVCVNYLDQPGPAEAVAAGVRAAGRKAIAVKADVADADAVERMFAAAQEALGPITDVVVNAGITGRKGRIDETPIAAVRRIFDTNVIGALTCCQSALRRMSTRHGGKGGNIVLVSSITSLSGGGGVFVAYAASKGAINTLVTGLAREVAAEGVRVNAVLPGIIDTDIHHDTGIAAALPQLAAQVPLARLGTPNEVAEAIVWLLSEKSSYVLGAILPVTGGRQ